jgi:hypothetical protein
LEFELIDQALHFLEVLTDRTRRCFVLFLDSEFEHFAGVGQAFAERVQRLYDRFQLRALAAQRLGLFRLVPDARIFQLPAYFLEPIALVSVVKDTPSAHRFGAPGRLTGCSEGWFPRV